ncbi:hypothetical protein COO60DRAFT_936205 [Scenedesmus sp. NREL 46B-D3]|nr:hypothetical protein COO60DRAFT_936205 [Scenedesmus sp. NREL 46B-D3]
MQQANVMCDCMICTANGMRRAQVLRIERVQNAKLWRRYCLKREELVDTRSEAGVNERLLFHGTSPATVDLIAQNGFDFRLSQVAAYGNGLYFADHSATAWGYCQKQDAANLAAAARGIVGAHAYTWAPPPPPAAAAMFGAGWGGLMAAAFGLGGPPPPAPAAGAWLPGGVPPPNSLPMPTGAAAPAAPLRGVAKRGKRALAAAAAAQQQQQQHYYQGGVLKMVVARVALGRQAQGASGMRKPPDGYDSVNSGNTQVPGVSMSVGSAWGVGRGKSRPKQPKQQQHQLHFCHVVFDNDMAYPEYVITLRP